MIGRIALSQHTSRDGSCRRRGSTDVPFKYKGWTMDFDHGPEGDRGGPFASSSIS
jgi:hypothetical protein